ncbi:hypothetical protein [Dictyobacter kobayashii]|uniref:Uncharacterized protein n=1 Tax=Dictyobacter kobayashii TaxID=2014872 RepID=A0A402AL36_9CHLR|nr:hypothetical protein [Dictyobacter kobayashii]GCE19831.1 hypothetical protein KDK_36310 [Dictyobacter kobayashii]
MAHDKCITEAEEGSLGDYSYRNLESRLIGLAYLGYAVSFILALLEFFLPMIDGQNEFGHSLIGVLLIYWMGSFMHIMAKAGDTFNLSLREYATRPKATLRKWLEFVAFNLNFGLCYTFLLLMIGTLYP